MVVYICSVSPWETDVGVPSSGSSLTAVSLRPFRNTWDYLSRTKYIFKHNPIPSHISNTLFLQLTGTSQVSDRVCIIIYYCYFSLVILTTVLYSLLPFCLVGKKWFYSKLLCILDLCLLLFSSEVLYLFRFVDCFVWEGFGKLVFLFQGDI